MKRKFKLSLILSLLAAFLVTNALAFNPEKKESRKTQYKTLLAQQNQEDQEVDTRDRGPRRFHHGNKRKDFKDGDRYEHRKWHRENKEERGHRRGERLRDGSGPCGQLGECPNFPQR